MGPRLVSMVFIQLIFMARDNLASRLVVGSVTALSYGWWIQQVPETLIGTAIATALLPTLSELVASEEQTKFKGNHRASRQGDDRTVPADHRDPIAGQPASDPDGLWFPVGRCPDDPVDDPGPI